MRALLQLRFGVNRLCADAEMIDSFADARSRAQAEADFKREAELLGSLSNEHVPHVYDAFSEKNAHYLVMDMSRARPSKKSSE